MKKWRLIVCLMLIVSMLATDMSLLNVHAGKQDPEGEIPSGFENAVISDVSGNLQDVSGNTQDVSENEIVEDTVSENESEWTSEESVSDNTLPFSEEGNGGGDASSKNSELSVEAREALLKITESKNVLALVYLTDTYDVLEQPEFDAKVLLTVKSGQSVLIRDVKVREGVVWYRAELTVDGMTYDGYLERDFLAYSDEDLLKWEEMYLFSHMNACYGDVWAEKGADRNLLTGDGPLGASSSGYADIDQFPRSYWSKLLALKKKYPKWTFVRLDTTGLDFNSVVNAQYGARSFIYRTAPEDYRDGQTGQANWYYASKKAIAYYLDPRNHLTENEVFQFELLSYNGSYHKESALLGILSSTFMAGKIPGEGMTYAKAFMQIGANYSVSPYHLASRVLLEQGSGKSSLISGTYTGYEGYYNYFNVGATGSTDKEVIVNGLKYAKSKGWDTRYKSLLGGAGTIGNNYIKIGQDTLYLQKFQVIPAGKHSLYTHQYQQNIQAPTTEGIKTYNTYNNSGSINNSFVFRIPVYANMPATVKQIKISQTEHTLTINHTEENGIVSEIHDSFALSAVAVDLDGNERADYPITWKTSNPKVATVDAKGNVTTVMSGTATITASADGKKANCKVIVKAPLYKIEITSPFEQFYVGESTRLNVSYVPTYTTDPVEDMVWESSDISVVTVEKGTILGTGKGNATVTAKVEGEDGRLHSAEFPVVVKACTVHFYDDFNELWVSHELSYGEMLEAYLPDISQLEGHESEVFSGWYTKPDGEGFRCKDTTAIYGDVSLYPHFISMEQDFFVKNVGDYTYTGKGIKPEVEVYDGEVRLVKGVDYTVSYANVKVVAGVNSKKKPTITVTGIGNYKGVQEIYFNILPKDISDDDITASDVLKAYANEKYQPNPKVMFNEIRLQKDVDYTVSYPATGKGAYKMAGVFPVEITGKKNFTGSRTVYLTITNNVLLSAVKVAEIPKQYYDDGNPVEPALTLKYGGKKLVKGEHYTVTYSNQYAAGTGTATITAIPGSGYSGRRTVSYKIAGISMSKVSVTGLSTQEYCGVPITIFEEDGTNSGFFPKFAITHTKEGTTRDLILGKDYKITYKNNLEKGTATVSFIGMGNFTGTLKKTFKINPYSIVNNKNGYIYLMADELGEQEYSRAGVKPKVTLYFKGADGEEKELKQGTDYTLSYVNNKKINDGSNPAKRPAVSIVGKGRFRGTWAEAAFFTIVPKDISEATSNGIVVTAQNFVYKAGKENYAPKLVVKDDGKVLKAGKDYKVESYEIIEQGESGILTYEAVISALVKADGTAEYIGNRRITYRVFRYSLNNAAIRKIPNQTYVDAEANSERGICPEITVTYKIKNAVEAQLFNEYGYEKYDVKKESVIGAADGNGIVLKKGDVILLRENRDYEFRENAYKNNRQTGTAKVTVHGIGLFAGGKSANYKIVRRALVERIFE